jgi:putative ATPase
LRVLTLNTLSDAALEAILGRYEKEFCSLPLTPDARGALIHMAQGDGRYLLNLVESIQNVTETLDVAQLGSFLQQRAALYDKHTEQHHNLISALHKSVRGSDPDAALYWLARMLAGGESPQFLGRRIIRMAVEDIGLADPEALAIALNAWKAYDQLGSLKESWLLQRLSFILHLLLKAMRFIRPFLQLRNSLVKLPT